MRIRHAIVGAVVALGVGLGAAPACAQVPLLTRAEALAAARDNIEVRLAGQIANAAQADVIAADRAPLPVVTAKISQIDFNNASGQGNPYSVKRTDNSLGVDWTWERGDKRGLRTEAARRAAAAAREDVDELRLQQQLAANAAFFDLLAAQSRVEELRAIARGADETAAALNRRTAAGDASRQDAARAAIEAARARGEADAARVEVQRVQLALALILGRPAAGLVADSDWPTAAVVAAALDDAMLDSRADLRAAAQRVQAAQSAAEGAAALRKTDITWGASYDSLANTGSRQLELRMAFPLALGYDYEGEIGRAQAQLAQARDALERTRNLARAELQRLRAELAGAEQRWQLYEGEIVPRAREVAERAELAYHKGSSPLTDLLDARRTLRSVLLDALAVRTDLAKASGAWQLRTAGLLRP